MMIDVRNLAKVYGRVRALDGISLRVPGGLFVLLGPNGAGKTTLMRILTAQLAPTSGSVSIGGLDAVRDPDRVRQQVGYLPQEFGFYRGQNALDMLQYIGTMKNIPASELRRQIDEVLEQLNLTADARRPLGTCSVGTKQRLGIAQALLGDPALLVLDEPTSGLDPEERIRFRNLLARLTRQRTVILSTHIAPDVEGLGGEVAVLQKGRLLFAGPPEQLAAAARAQGRSVEPGLEAGYRAILEGDANHAQA